MLARFNSCAAAPFRMRLALVLVLLLGASLTAKGPRHLTVTFHSDPEGAMLYANQDLHLIGYTPVQLKYEPSKGFRAGTGCENLQRVTVRWASGAEASIDSLRACPQNGGDQQFVFKRPDSILGREIDAQFALELLRNQILAAQRQVRAPVIQFPRFCDGYVSPGAAFSDSLNGAPPCVPRPTVTCQSDVIGSTVYTRCR